MRGWRRVVGGGPTLVNSRQPKVLEVHGGGRIWRVSLLWGGGHVEVARNGHLLGRGGGVVPEAGRSSMGGVPHELAACLLRHAAGLSQQTDGEVTKPVYDSLLYSPVSRMLSPSSPPHTLTHTHTEGLSLCSHFPLPLA